MMCENENPNQVFLIDGDISKTLINCATDANTSTRQEYGKILLLILRQEPLEDILKHIHDIMSTLLMISEDEVSSVRMHFVDKITGIFLQIRQHASPDLEFCFYDRLLQILLQYFQDEDYVVKGEAYATFILLLDKGAIDKKLIMDKVCPAILNYVKHFDDESQAGRTSTAIILMGRIAPIIGAQAIEELFLDHYIEMCSCAIITVRRPCATILPVMCQVLGTKITEEKLLDAFDMMCDSKSWGTRNICAESIALISVVCSPECRRDRLTPIVLRLAKDSNKCVVSATLKVLGQFISTFATPTITGLAYTHNGELYIINPLDSEFNESSDPTILSNYNDYVNRFDESTQITMSTSSASSTSSSTTTTSSSSSSTSDYHRVNEDGLNCEEIAKMIQDNILKISKQINENMFIKKRRHDDNNLKTYSQILMAFDDSSADSNLTESAPPTYSSSDTSEMLNTTASSNEIPAEEENSLNSCARETGGEKKGWTEKKSRNSMTPSEHFWRKNTPTDLSMIIKRAINEGNQQQQEKHKLMLPAPPICPPTAAIEIETPTSEEPSTPLSWDGFFSKNNNYKKCSKSTEHLNRVDDDDGLDVNGVVSSTGDDDDSFNEFNSHKFWYISPDLVLDNDLINEPEPFDLEDMMNTRSRFDPPTDFNQNVIPVGILECFVKMVLYEEDEDMNLTCAYNFPAVAFTIGKENWHIIKNLLQYLCDDLDWKVRKTIASSIDLLAMVLGKELATQDLLPIYLGFFKDLDQVKSNAIRNFAKFLKIIDPSKHEEILSNIGICLRVDSKTNWRIKEDLAQQIVLIIKMYDSINRHDDLLYLTSVTGIFLEDKISCVREIAADAMTEIIRICSQKQREAIIKHYLVMEFSLNYSWRKRQTFVNIFYKYIKANYKNVSEIVRMILQDIRRLSYDSVPNIRLLVAKCLVQLLNSDSNKLTSGDSEDVGIINIIRRFQEDDDRDVKETAHLIELEDNKNPITSAPESFESTTTIITTPAAQPTAPKSETVNATNVSSFVADTREDDEEY